MRGGIYKHKKTGQLYQVADTMGFLEVINTTNAQDGQEMVMYLDPKKPNKIFVMERKEFDEKFTLFKTLN